jgi:hypothetical protein
LLFSDETRLSPFLFYFVLSKTFCQISISEPIAGHFYFAVQIQGFDSQPSFKEPKIKNYFPDTCTFAEFRKYENIFLKMKI